MASANPKPQAASTEPDTYLIFVALPNSPKLSKYFLAIFGKEVTILLPATWLGDFNPAETGACKHNLHLPKPRSLILLIVI